MQGRYLFKNCFANESERDRPIAFHLSQGTGLCSLSPSCSLFHFLSPYHDEIFSLLRSWLLIYIMPVTLKVI